MGEGLADSNPVVGTHRPTEEITRERVLFDDELALVWRHSGHGDFGAIVRLLILTGQRREEVGGMLRRELDLAQGLWRIGADRTKNGLLHEIPLSSHALDIIGLQAASRERELIFGSRAGPFQGWSKAKTALDARILSSLREERGEKASLVPWRLHDVRRTAATRMADLGILPHVIEAVLNHISGHKAGVAGIYNRATYAAEKRRALELWAQHVHDLVHGFSSNVSLADRRVPA
jgi:integrase